MKAFLTLLSTLYLLSAAAQLEIKHYGNIALWEESGIEALYQNNQENRSGYRIQVFTGSTAERVKAVAIQTAIEEKYEVKAYVAYESPLFKVRVGNFVDKLEAVALKHRLAKEYPNTYIVRVNKINFLESPLREESSGNLEFQVGNE